MSEPFKGWAILELFGHRRLAGMVEDVEMFGGRMCRIDVPDAKDPTKMLASQLYGHAAVYGMTPCTEETAREVARMSQPAPVQRWELPAPEPRDRGGDSDGDDNDQDGLDSPL